MSHTNVEPTPGSSKNQPDGPTSPARISMLKSLYPIAKSSIKKSQFFDEIDKTANILNDTSLIGNPKLRRPFHLGWKREVVLQHHFEYKKKKANVYYYSPSGKKCCTYKEVARLLSDGLQKDNFSFRQALIWVSAEFENLRVANKSTSINYGTRKITQKTISETECIQNRLKTGFDVEPTPGSSKKPPDAPTSPAGMFKTVYPIAKSNITTSQFFDKIDKTASILNDTSLIGNLKLKRPFHLGWKREVVLQSTQHFEHTKKKANVYYCSPSGKKCCTYKEVARFLSDGLQKDNFSFRQALIWVSDEFESLREANKSTSINYGTKKITQKTISETKCVQNRLKTGFGEQPIENGKQKYDGNEDQGSPYEDMSACLQADVNAPKDLVTVPVFMPFCNQADTIKNRSWPEQKNNETNQKHLAEVINKTSKNRNLTNGTNTRKRNLEVDKESDKIAKKRILPFRTAAKRQTVKNFGSGTTPCSINSTPVTAPSQSSAVMPDIITVGRMLRPGIKLSDVASGKSISNSPKKGTINVSDFKYKKPFIYGWTRKLVTNVLYIAPSGEKFNTAGEIAKYITNDENLTSENFTFAPLYIGVSNNEKKNIWKCCAQ